jgi:UDP-glucose 4-epimerase
MWSPCIVRLDNHQPTKLLNVHFVQCDVRDRQRVRHLFEKSTFSDVFHLESRFEFELNVMGSV